MTELVVGLIHHGVGRRVIMLILLFQLGGIVCNVQASSRNVIPLSSGRRGGGSSPLRSSQADTGERIIAIDVGRANPPQHHDQHSDDHFLPQHLQPATTKKVVVGTIMAVEEEDHQNDDPCLGASSLSLQVQLWCEYYHGIGLI